MVGHIAFAGEVDGDDVVSFFTVENLRDSGFDGYRKLSKMRGYLAPPSPSLGLYVFGPNTITCRITKFYSLDKHKLNSGL